MNDKQAEKVLDRLRADSLSLARAMSPGLSVEEIETLIAFIVGEVMEGVGEGVGRRIKYSVRVHRFEPGPVSVVH